MGSRLAELFVDITLRGGAVKEMKSLKEESFKLNRALGDLKTRTRDFGALTEREMRNAQKTQRLFDFDEKLYQSPKYRKSRDAVADADFSRKSVQSVQESQQDQANHANFMKNYGMRRQQEIVLRDIQKDKNKRQQDELLLLQRNTLERGKGYAVMQLLKNRLVSGSTANMGIGIGSGGSQTTNIAAKTAGAIGGMFSIWSLAITGAVTGAIYAGVQLAKSASPDAAATYEGSWKLVTNEIGQSLIPALTTVSRGLQGLASIIAAWKNSDAAKNTESFLDAIGFKILGPFDSFFKSLNQDGMYTSSQHKARFTSFEEGWRRVQQDAASGGSMEAKLLQQAIEGNQIAAQIAMNTGRPAPRPGNSP